MQSRGVGPRLGKRLSSAGLVERGRLGAALALSTAEPMAIVEALVRLGVDAELIARVAQSATGVNRATRARLASCTPEASATLPPEFMRRCLLVPIELVAGTLVVACGDPTDRHPIDEASRLSRRHVRVEVATVPDLLHAIRTIHGDVALPGSRPTFVLGNRSSGAATKVDDIVAANARTTRVSIAPPAPAPVSGSESLARPDPVEAPPWSEAESWERWDTGPTQSPATDVLARSGRAIARSNTRRRFEREARAVPIPSDDLGATLASLRAARSRDRIFEIVLASALPHARQAFWFRVRDQRIEGMDSVGSSLGAMAVRRIVLPLSPGSTIHRVVVDGTPHYGPLGVVATDQVLRAAIGSRGGRLSIHGIWIDGRPVAVLVADDLRTGDIGHERIGAVCHAAGQALRRLVRDPR